MTTTPPDEPRRLWPKTATISTVRSFYTLREPTGPRWPIALQGGVSIAAPIAVMTLLGHPDLGYQAASGAFTALYLSNLRPVDRARVLPIVAAALIAAAALGIVFAASAPLALIGLAVVTMAASGFVYSFRLGPPGPLFFVLVYGLAGHVTSTVDGVDAGGFLLALSAGCVFSYLVTLTPLLLRRVRRESPQAFRDILPGPVWDDEVRTLLIRSAAIAVVGVVAGVFVDPDRAYWIVASGVAVAGMAVARRVAVGRGLHRVVGTITGAALYFGLVLVPWAGLWLAALLGLLQFLIELLIVRHYALALTFITPLVLLLTGAATGDLGSTATAVERIVDTAVGAGIGMLAVLIPAFGSRRGTAA